MTDRNDGRPKHSASHIHCAVPFFVPEAERKGGQRGAAGKGLCGRRGMHRAACGRASGLRGQAEVLGKGVSLCGGEGRSSAGSEL